MTACMVIRALNCRGILDAPVSGYGLSRPVGAGFAGRVVADRENEVGLAACAERDETAFAPCVQVRLGED
jgi:hypothetical protein